MSRATEIMTKTTTLRRWSASSLHQRSRYINLFDNFTTNSNSTCNAPSQIIVNDCASNARNALQRQTRTRAGVNCIEVWPASTGGRPASLIYPLPFGFHAFPCASVTALTFPSCFALPTLGHSTSAHSQGSASVRLSLSLLHTLRALELLHNQFKF